MKTITSILSLWLVLVTGPVIQAQEFVPFTKEFKKRNSTFPQQLEVDLPAPGHVELIFISLPEGTQPTVDFPEGEGHYVNGDWGQARLSAGKHIITIRDRRGRNTRGTIHVKIIVSPENDPTEPNDTPESAKEITLGENSLIIFPATDIDYWKITLPDRGYLTIQALNPPERFDVYCEVIDPFGKILGVDNVHTELPGTYTLKFIDKRSDYGDRSKVIINVEFFNEEDPAEPNDNIADASILSIGIWQQAINAFGNDRDFYEIVVPEHGYLTITTRDVPEGLVLNWLLYDDKGEQLNLAYPFSVSPRTYYLCLFGRRNNWNLDPYAFKIDLLPVNKITPNNEQKARVIKPLLDYYIRLPNEQDTDRFAVKIRRLSIVKLSALLPEGSDYLFNYQEDKRPLIQNMPLWIRTDKRRPEFGINSRRNRVSNELFPIRVDVEQEFDQSEPNDFFYKPAVLEPEKPRTFYLYPSNDIDWFKVNVEEEDDYFVHLVWGDQNSSEQPKDLSMSWHDLNGDRLYRINMIRKPYGYTSYPIKVETPGEFLISINASIGSYQPIVIGFSKKTKPTKEVATEKSDLDVFVAGIELDENSKKNMKLMVEEGGGMFFSADSASQIGEKLEEIFEQIEKRSKWPYRAIIVLILALLGIAIGGYFWWRFKIEKRS